MFQVAKGISKHGQKRLVTLGVHEWSGGPKNELEVYSSLHKSL
jgi:hypothetical protein